MLLTSQLPKELLQRWIAQGAPYERHWAYTPMEPWRQSEASQRANVPSQRIDAVIDARLEQEDLAAAPQADPITLLRRLSIDLTGLPPTSQEVDEFLADPSQEAFAKSVDRLLNSPRRNV